MSARLNAVCQSDQDIEDRIFELLGEMKTPLEIVRELDMDVREGYRLIAKVIGERDTPNAFEFARASSASPPYASDRRLRVLEAGLLRRFRGWRRWRVCARRRSKGGASAV